MVNKDLLYTEEVLSYISCSEKYKKRIKEDLLISLEEKRKYSLNESAESLLGPAYELAKEFIENLDLDEVKREQNNYSFPANKHGYYRYGYGYEYKSDINIFGIPLVHVNYRTPFSKAKGIIAIGPVALGLLSIGGLSFGLIGIGGFSLGLLLSFGGIALSIGIALGGIAVSFLLACGGFAIAKVCAIGGLALSDIFAIGGYAKGGIAIGGKINCLVGFYEQGGTGKYIFPKLNSWKDMGLTIKDILISEKGNLSYWYKLILKIFWKI